MNQIENGYGQEVENGEMPLYTYTFYVHHEEERIFDYSVDSLEEGFILCLTWLKDNR